ncbi:MAG TPA: proline dehydrogenase family protein [Bacteroidota bacterium]|nr:proline dehydrogenase family protein [Bacteroidota bacterium]
MSILNSVIAKTLPFIPKIIVGKVSSRYIAGTKLSEAISVIRQLNAGSLMATLDILGEDIHERSAAEAIGIEWRSVLKEISGQKLDSNISVKPSQMGFRIDPEYCYDNIKSLVDEARRVDNFVRIDMEDSTMTTATIEIYKRLRADGYDNVGIAIQAYLHRSDADVRALARLKASFRLCKGIYRESPDIAYQDRDEIRRNYALLLRTMLEAGCYVGIATHDEYLVEKSYELIQKGNLKKSQYEFQMLLGVRELLRASIVKAGHRLRVYVPFGEQWYAYSVRRLKENPEIAGYVLKAMFLPNHK